MGHGYGMILGRFMSPGEVICNICRIPIDCMDASESDAVIRHVGFSWLAEALCCPVLIGAKGGGAQKISQWHVARPSASRTSPVASMLIPVHTGRLSVEVLPLEA